MRKLIKFRTSKNRISIKMLVSLGFFRVKINLPFKKI